MPVIIYQYLDEYKIEPHIHERCFYAKHGKCPGGKELKKSAVCETKSTQPKPRWPFLTDSEIDGDW